ncbi:folate-binding protein YgfZ [Hyphomicrobium sp. CS1GBMeth3]|uniref:CAF17-like 4Fe-4S cluster assembly/insertion protein YgfZ n=1 Tax=Hyphomicrobium sp. CS1GBMeth3 TaxID=1892845 RepID=UPI000931834F|nr:folate-binding protein YgfZ [Hyphomicrobium sp. CS1GBMeth3]
MSAAPKQVAVLDDRGVVSVTGPDAEKLLAGLVTNEIAELAEVPAVYAALLSPQGKVLFDFLVVKTDAGFLLDTARARAGDLVKRLSIYKLRADVQIRDVSEDFVVAAAWGGEVEALARAHVFPDPRLPALGVRVLVAAKDADPVLAGLGGERVSAQAYHAHRIALGVPEGGRDFAFGDTFPHEALLDQLHGVSFTKGCFVGQEVVSRMQHRTTVRKRVVPVVGNRVLPTETPPVLAGEVEIGRLGSVAGARGLALLRIDRAGEAQRDGVALTSGGVPLAVELPAFATFRIEVAHGSA